MRIIQLLEQKNHYLEKFLTLNELQLRLLEETDVDTLDEFYQKREKILALLKYIDEQLSLSQQELGAQTLISEEQEAAIQKLLFIKDEYVFRILDQDVQILAKMDAIKTQILNELSEIQSAKKAVRGYHSKGATQRSTGRNKLAIS